MNEKPASWRISARRGEVEARMSFIIVARLAAPGSAQAIPGRILQGKSGDTYIDHKNLVIDLQTLEYYPASLRGGLGGSTRTAFPPLRFC